MSEIVLKGTGVCLGTVVLPAGTRRTELWVHRDTSVLRVESSGGTVHVVGVIVSNPTGAEQIVEVSTWARDGVTFVPDEAELQTEEA